MIYSNVIQTERGKEEIYRVRYRVFVVEDKDAPPELYPNGIMKDECDDYGIHIGCFENGSLLGFLTIIFKKNDLKLPIEMQHDLQVEENSIEIMRLVISRDKVPVLNYGKRAKILEQLLKRVKEVVENHRVRYLYLVSTKNAKHLYERIGFSQIGEFRTYFNISDECPMKLDLQNIKINF